jgi:hypothetical protein
MAKETNILIVQDGIDYEVDVMLETFDIDVMLEGTVFMDYDQIEPIMKDYLENPNDLDTLFVGNQEITVNAYTHTQSVASSTWNINHSLARRDVVIRVFNSSHIEVLAEIENIDNNNSVVRFAFPVSGTAECR